MLLLPRDVLTARQSSDIYLCPQVIKKGAFIDLEDGDGKKKGNTNMGKAELMDILRADISLDDVPQSGEVDDTMMDRILDREFLMKVDKEGKKEMKIPYPESGRGYEVVRSEGASGGLMGSIV